MALTDCGLFYFPSLTMMTDRSYADFEGAGERHAHVFCAKKTGNITNIHIYTDLVTTGAVIRVEMQQIGSNGIPNGVILGATNSAYGTTTIASTDDYTLKTVALGEVAPITKGSFYAVVYKWNDDASPGNMRLSSRYTNTPQLNNIYGFTDTAEIQTSGTLTVGTAYRMYNYISGDDFSNVFAEGAAANVDNFEGVATGTTPTTWTNSSEVKKWRAASYGPECILEYDDGTYSQQDSAHYSTITVGSATTPDEVGNYFKSPFPFRAIGFWVRFNHDYDVTFALLSADGTTLANVAASGNVYRYNYGGTQFSMWYFDGNPADTVNIVAGTYYRVVITPSGSSMSIGIQSVPEADAMTVMPLGADCVYTYRTDAGSWTNSTTQRLTVGLIGDQLDDGAGGGGGPLISGRLVR